MKKAINYTILTILLFAFIIGVNMSVATFREVAIMYALVFGSAAGMWAICKRNPDLFKK